MGVYTDMVLCVGIECSKRSAHNKGISFHRIPAIIKGRSKQEFELNKKRMNGFLSAISREDLSDKIITNDRICSTHFISGKPAYLFDVTNPDWLPTLNLDHLKRKAPEPTSELRWERVKRKRERQIEMMSSCGSESIELPEEKESVEQVEESESVE